MLHVGLPLSAASPGELGGHAFGCLAAEKIRFTTTQTAYA